MNDIITGFLLEELDIRGSIVQLETVWQTIQGQRNYPASVCELLGQICSVSALVAANLKQQGRLTFQLRGQGGVSLLVVDCSKMLNLRGYAKHEDNLIQTTTARDLIGEGQLVMSLDIEGASQPYQSHVPIEGNTIAEIFQHYLTQSEQQPAILILAADENRASGLFLQKLPDADIKDADGWDRVSMLVKTIKQQELQELNAIDLLGRIFAEETVRVFEPKQVHHVFPPDREKICGMLRALGETEIRHLLAEHGEIVVVDDLSNHTYRFSPQEALLVLQTQATIH